MAKNFLRTERGERIDHPDFQHAAEVSQRDAVTQIVDGVLVGAQPIHNNDQVANYVVQGFDTSVTAGTQVTVQGGTAFLSFRENGQTAPGCVLTGGPASKTIDMLNFTDGAYGVYIRFDFRESNFLNRLFWNPLVIPPIEVPRSIATRKSESWDMVIEQTPPGTEWLKVATLTKVGGVVTPTDARDFFFEGLDADNYTVPDSQWGSVTDRLTARNLHGIFGFRRFIRAVFRQLQDIISGGGVIPGTDGWWTDPTSGDTAGNGPRSLEQLNDEKFGRSGQQTLQGDIIPDTAAAYDLGNALANRFAVGYIQQLFVGDGVTAGAGGVFPELFTSAALCGTEFNPFDTGYFVNSILSFAPGDTSKVGGGYLTINTNVAGAGGNPPILEFNDTLVAGGQSDNDIARIICRHTPPAGDAFLEIRAGIFAGEGLRDIRLNGTNNKIARNCLGQNGIERAVEDMAGRSISLTGATTVMTLPFTPTGVGFGVGDAVLHMEPNLSFQNLLAANQIVMSAAHRVIGANTIEVAFSHTLDPPTGGSLLLSVNETLTVTVLRS